MFGISLIAVLAALLVGSVGMGIGREVFGETNRTLEASAMLRSNKCLAFFLLFGGAGIAEEALYRLMFLSLFWRCTHRPWLAVLLSALLFGAYHLTPLNDVHRIFWQFPISQCLASSLIGVVWGYLFVKRGYETTVLGHTLAGWIPLILLETA